MKRLTFIIFLIVVVFNGYSQTTFSDTIKFNKTITVGETGDIIEEIKVQDGKVKMVLGGNDYEIQPITNAPIIDSVVANDYKAIVFYYNQTIVASQSDTSRFDLYISGDPIGFTNMGIGTSTLTFTTGDTIRPGNSLSYLYLKPTTGGIRNITGIQAEDAYGNIKNSVPEAVGSNLLASWGLNNTWVDDSSNYTFIKSAGAGFSNYSAEGTKSVDVNGTIHYIHTNSSINLTSDFTIFFTYLSWVISDYPKCILSNRDEDGGIEIYSNGADGNVEVRTFNASGDSVSAYSNYALARGKWNSIGITGGTDGYINFWINGVDEDSNDTLARTDFAVDDTIYIGADLDNDFKAYGFVDWPRFYDGKLQTNNFINLHNAIRINPAIDTIAPLPDTSNVGSINDSTLLIQFDKELANTSLDLTSFEYKEDGVEKTLSNPVVSGTTIKFQVPIPSGDASLVCRYDSSGANDLRDIYNNYVDTFYLDVDNRLQSGLNLIAHYKLDNNLNDASNNSFNATPNTTIFSSSIVNAGTHSLYATGSSNGVTPNLGVDSSITIACWVYRSSVISYTDFFSQLVSGFSANPGGIELSYNFTSGYPFVTLEDAGENEININGSAAGTGINEWIHVVYEFDFWADTMAFWVNGVFNSGNKAITNVPAINSTWTIGRGKSTLDGYLDDVQVYDSLANDEQVLWLYNHPGESIGSGSVDPVCPCGGTYPNCDPCPEGVDFDVFWSANFDHWATDKTLPVAYNTSSSLTQQINDAGGIAPEPMWEQDFFGTSTWRDGDVGFLNTLLGLNDTYTGGVYNRNYRDSIVNDPVTNNPGIKIPYRADRANSYYGESAWVTIGGEDYDEIWFGFNVQFSPEWDPVRGGKIPGYGGGNPTDFQPARLPEVVSDEKGYTVGYAGRTMWDAGGFNTYSNYFNNPAYIYARSQIDAGLWPADTSVYPSKIQWDEFQPNCDTCDNGGTVKKALLYNPDGSWMPRWTETSPRWYSVVIHLIGSTGTSANGAIEGFINGHLIHQINNIRWYEDATGQEGFNRFRISAFFGGSSTNEAASKDSWFQIDDFWYGMPKLGHNNPGIGEGTLSNPGTYISLPNWPKN